MPKQRMASPIKNEAIPGLKLYTLGVKSLLILGRQPALGLAELESLYGPDVLTPLRSGSVLMDIEPEAVDFKRLGGSIKLARVLTVLDTLEWSKIEEYLNKTIPEHLQYVPDGKLTLGLSIYGLRVGPREIGATALRLKKMIKASGRGVRIVPNKSAALNSAQVLHNGLTTPNGWELVFVRWDNKTILAQTVAEQDIEAYARRDQNRPMRDARVGMLPPKLAQILINLTNPAPGSLVLDPFCGTGVVLQEAALMGFKYLGSDIEPRMVEYSEGNLAWLNKTHGLEAGLGQVEIGDATTYTWSHPVSAVAGETYLGKPFSSTPPPAALEKTRRECDEIHEKFLRNIAEQIAPGTRLALGVPAWSTKKGFVHLRMLAKLGDLGYTRKKFVHVRDQDLIYHREGQAVARELVVLEKK